MSVLIKGVNLPSGSINGGEVTGLLIDIPVAANPTCEVFYETADGAEESIYVKIKVQEVKTPHGRLIDADSIMHAVSLMIDLEGDAAIIMEDIIEGETTVIEAEE